MTENNAKTTDIPAIGLVDIESSQIQDVRLFMQIGKQTVGRLNLRRLCLYTGLQFEELGEKMEAMGMAHLAASMKAEGRFFKQGSYDKYVSDAVTDNPQAFVEALDADMDLAWVTFGSAISQGADVDGAWDAVTSTNMAKFAADEKGNPVVIFDANGKIKKPEGWVGPDLTPFINRLVGES